MWNLGSIFKNGFVLQRNQTNPVWGQAPAKSVITISIAGHDIKAHSDETGHFQAVIPPMEACSGLTLYAFCSHCKETIEVNDIAVGEVWIAAGQSNMEFLLAYDWEYSSEAQTSPEHNIRYYEIPKIDYYGQELYKDVSQWGIWRKADSENKPYFSAVAYYFAVKLYEKLQVPVGIIGCNYGGTSAVTLIPQNAFQTNPLLMPLWNQYQSTCNQLDMDWYEKFVLSRDKACACKEALEFTKYVYQNHCSITQMNEMKKDINPIVFKKQVGPKFYNRPGGLFQTMVSHIIPYGVKGVLWYQGESDDYREEFYSVLLSALIKGWRCCWDCDLPFLFVQLPPFGCWNGVNGSRFPKIRAAQLLTAIGEKAINHVHIICSLDAGDSIDIHPKYKRTIGERLERLAERKIYQLSDSPLCPMLVEMNLNGDCLELIFSECEDGLFITEGLLKELTVSVHQQVITDYTITVKGHHLFLCSSQLIHADCVTVSYAQSACPAPCIFNNSRQPAFPFCKTACFTHTC